MTSRNAWFAEMTRLKEMGLKRCTKCKEEKPGNADHFYRNQYSFDGLKAICKVCLVGHPHEQHSAAGKRNTASNLKHNHTEKSKQARREYRKKNAEQDRARVKNRRYQKKNGGTFTPAEWDNLCKFYDYRCLACGEYKPLTVDHVIPLSKGGKNDISNIQPLCLTCNSLKGTKTIDYRIAYNQPCVHEIT